MLLLLLLLLQLLLVLGGLDIAILIRKDRVWDIRVRGEMLEFKFLIVLEGWASLGSMALLGEILPSLKIIELIFRVSRGEQRGGCSRLGDSWGCRFSINEKIGNRYFCQF